MNGSIPFYRAIIVSHYMEHTDGIVDSHEQYWIGLVSEIAAVLFCLIPRFECFSRGLFSVHLYNIHIEGLLIIALWHWPDAQLICSVVFPVLCVTASKNPKVYS